MKKTMLLGLFVLMFTLKGFSQEEIFGAWMYIPSTDILTDANRSGVITANASGALTVVFLENGLHVLYHWGKWFAGDIDNDVIIQYRIDRSPPSVQHYWRMSADNKTAAMPLINVPGFLREVQMGNKIIIRVIDPYDGETITSEFSLYGLSAALNRLGRK
jgi:hypothetical protein